MAEQGTITVRVLLQADMRKYLAKGQAGAQPVQLAAGATAGDLLASLGVPEGETVTIGIDGELGGPGHVLRDGADVTLFSPMEGG